MKLTREEAEQFLFQEARLLDERRFEEWMGMFTSDGLYWIPIEEGTDPRREPSILYDNADLRAQRIYQLLNQPHYSQMPPSRTIHFISNVEVDGGDEDNAVVRCNLLLCELRPGDHQQLQFGLGSQRQLYARCEYRLRHDEKWLIVLKKIVLINRDLPICNLTFIV
jgi:3-phenylpropionate/cinnamic acid dioxygenase small subunit